MPMEAGPYWKPVQAVKPRLPGIFPYSGARRMDPVKRMEPARMRKWVSRVTLVERSESGEATARTLYKRDWKKKKKQTDGLKEIGKGIRRVHNAARTFESEYVRRHDRSNGKKRDGWIRDLPKNVAKSARKGAKKVEPSRWL
jgi:hypothetical protein